MYLSSKLNETPVRLRDLINSFIFLSARIKHLLSLPADQLLSTNSGSSTQREDEPWRIGLGLGNGSSNGGNGKGKEKEAGVWDGFKFTVPGFHDELFWDCVCDGNCATKGLTVCGMTGKDVIVGSEMQILKRLGFNMQVSLLASLLVVGILW